MAVFSHLETEQASDTLEALDPAVQRDLIESLDKERAAVLIDEMTPAQAADVLAALPRWEVGVILNLLADDPEKSEKIKSILANQEERVLDFCSSAFLQFPPDMSVAQVRAEFRTAARRKMDITYIYVIDEAEHVVGVLDLKTLLLAEEQSLLRDIMTTSVVSLPPESTLRDASEFFGRYLFRVLPVINEHGRILGILPYRDVVALRHRFVK
jgi:magnesium transporter